MNYLAVIEQNEGLIMSNKLFVGDKAVERAEEHFLALIKENSEQVPSITALDAHLDNGYFENGGYMASISWPEVA